MKKLLTIVIPTYNMEVLLPRCLNSLLHPFASSDLEVLVVNDGSKDNSLQVANDFECKYPNIIKVINKPNGNYGSTINKGIEYANGKYFRILDSDDFYQNDQLALFIDKIKNCDSDLILTDYYIDRDKHADLKRISGIQEEKVLSLDNVQIADIGNYAMHGLTVKTSILKENRISLSTGISYTDTEYCYYPLNYSQSICYFRIPVYRYQVGRDGQTVSLDSQIRCMSHMRKIIERMLVDLGESVPESVFKNKCFVASSIINLYYSTALCYDKSNLELPYLSEIDNIISQYKYIDIYLRKRHMFGVPFYRRFHDKHKLSNGTFFTQYYQLIKLCSKIYRTLL